MTIACHKHWLMQFLALLTKSLIIAFSRVRGYPCVAGGMCCEIALLALLTNAGVLHPINKFTPQHTSHEPQLLETHL